MPMSRERPMASREDIATSLRERASQLWGHERAEALHSTIDQTARRIWQISKDLPSPDEEPGFYL